MTKPKPETKTKKAAKQFNQSKNLVYASYLFVLATSLLAWNTRFIGSVRGFSIPSLFAILAFGFMWVHYLGAYLKSNYQSNLNLKKITTFTQWFVFLTIIVHPLAIVNKLYDLGYGLPPTSFKSVFGVSGALFISLGSISFLAFLAFEFKKQLSSRPKLWETVLKLNDIAMLLIIFHGFKLGFVINSSAVWYRYVWLGYGLSLLYFYYDKYINKERLRKYHEAFIVGLVIVAMAFIGLATTANTRSKLTTSKSSQSSGQNISQQNSQDTEGYISTLQLSRNNGLSGRKCWIAVDSTVYDATNNPQWKDGEHTPSKGQAKCGQDLTRAIAESPHGESVLSDLEVVGKYRNQ